MASVVTAASSDGDETTAWAESLPTDVAFLILDILLESIDHVRFSAVCRSWCFLAKHYNHVTKRWDSNQTSSRPPMLMVCNDRSVNRSPVFGSLYSVREDQTYKNVRIELPEEQYASYWCFPGHGWLAQVEFVEYSGRLKNKRTRHRCRITLHDPFKSEAIPIILPPLHISGEYPNYRLQVRLSADPSSNPDSYLALAFFNRENEIAFLQRREEQISWQSKQIQRARYHIYDAKFHKDRIYAFQDPGLLAGRILSFSLGLNSFGTREEVILDVSEPYDNIPQYYRWTSYLVESIKGDLLLVRRFYIPEKVDEPKKVEWFKVYKVLFTETENNLQVTTQDSIGDEVHFVGDDTQAMSVLASNCPGYQPDSIYDSCDRSIFKLATMTEQHCNWGGQRIEAAYWITPPPPTL